MPMQWLLPRHAFLWQAEDFTVVVTLYNLISYVIVGYSALDKAAQDARLAQVALISMTLLFVVSLSCFVVIRMFRTSKYSVDLYIVPVMLVANLSCSMYLQLLNETVGMLSAFLLAYYFILTGYPYAWLVCFAGAGVVAGVVVRFVVCASSASYECSVHDWVEVGIFAAQFLLGSAFYFSIYRLGRLMLKYKQHPARNIDLFPDLATLDALVFAPVVGLGASPQIRRRPSEGGILAAPRQSASTSPEPLPLLPKSSQQLFATRGGSLVPGCVGGGVLQSASSEPAVGARGTGREDLASGFFAERSLEGGAGVVQTNCSSAPQKTFACGKSASGFAVQQSPLSPRTRPSPTAALFSPREGNGGPAMEASSPRRLFPPPQATTTAGTMTLVSRGVLQGRGAAGGFESEASAALPGLGGAASLLASFSPRRNAAAAEAAAPASPIFGTDGALAFSEGATPAFASPRTGSSAAVFQLQQAQRGGPEGAASFLGEKTSPSSSRLRTSFLEESALHGAAPPLVDCVVVASRPSRFESPEGDAFARTQRWKAECRRHASGSRVRQLRAMQAALYVHRSVYFRQVRRFRRLEAESLPDGSREVSWLTSSEDEDKCSEEEEPLHSELTDSDASYWQGPSSPSAWSASPSAEEDFDISSSSAEERDAWLSAPQAVASRLRSGAAGVPPRRSRETSAAAPFGVEGRRSVDCKCPCHHRRREGESQAQEASEARLQEDASQKLAAPSPLSAFPLSRSAFLNSLRRVEDLLLRPVPLVEKASDQTPSPTGAEGAEAKEASSIDADGQGLHEKLVGLVEAVSAGRLPRRQSLLAARVEALCRRPSPSEETEAAQAAQKRLGPCGKCRERGCAAFGESWEGAANKTSPPFRSARRRATRRRRPVVAVWGVSDLEPVAPQCRENSSEEEGEQDESCLLRSRPGNGPSPASAAARCVSQRRSSLRRRRRPPDRAEAFEGEEANSSCAAEDSDKAERKRFAAGVLSSLAGGARWLFCGSARRAVSAARIELGLRPPLRPLALEASRALSSSSNASLVAGREASFAVETLSGAAAAADLEEASSPSSSLCLGGAALLRQEVFHGADSPALLPDGAETGEPASLATPLSFGPVGQAALMRSRTSTVRRASMGGPPFSSQRRNNNPTAPESCFGVGSTAGSRPSTQDFAFLEPVQDPLESRAPSRSRRSASAAVGGASRRPSVAGCFGGVSQTHPHGPGEAFRGGLGASAAAGEGPDASTSGRGAAAGLFSKKKKQRSARRASRGGGLHLYGVSPKVHDRMPWWLARLLGWADFALEDCRRRRRVFQKATWHSALPMPVRDPFGLFADPKIEGWYVQWLNAFNARYFSSAALPMLLTVAYGVVCQGLVRYKGYLQNPTMADKEIEVRCNQRTPRSKLPSRGGEPEGRSAFERISARVECVVMETQESPLGRTGFLVFAVARCLLQAVLSVLILAPAIFPGLFRGRRCSCFSPERFAGGRGYLVNRLLVAASALQ